MLLCEFQFISCATTSVDDVQFMHDKKLSRSVPKQELKDRITPQISFFHKLQKQELKRYREGRKHNAKLCARTVRERVVAERILCEGVYLEELFGEDVHVQELSVKELFFCQAKCNPSSLYVSSAGVNYQIPRKNDLIPFVAVHCYSGKRVADRSGIIPVCK
jgi:RNase adaptor protein for sRNA GlmZ degradation